MSIVLPGRIPSHSLGKAATSPQQNRGVSPSLAIFLSYNCSATFKKLSRSRSRPAPATVTNTTRVQQGANANDLTFELEGWGGGEEAWRTGELRNLYLMYP